MEYTDRASSYLIQRCEPSDAAQVQRHVDEFHALHEGVLSKLNHLEDRLCLAGGPDAVVSSIYPAWAFILAVLFLRFFGYLHSSDFSWF